MTLDDALNKACSELPEGAEIYVTVEKGAGWVDARNWDGDDFSPDTADKSLAEQVIEALQWCKDSEPKTPNAALEGRGGKT